MLQVTVSILGFFGWFGCLGFFFVRVTSLCSADDFCCVGFLSNTDVPWT